MMKIQLMGRDFFKIELDQIYLENDYFSVVTLEGPERCSICLDVLWEAAVLRGCHHAFHVDCLKKWISITMNCPLCRLSIILL